MDSEVKEDLVEKWDGKPMMLRIIDNSAITVFEHINQWDRSWAVIVKAVDLVLMGIINHRVSDTSQQMCRLWWFKPQRD